MSNVSISEITQEITSASELDGNELLLISDVNNSTYTSKKCNLSNIKSYVGTTINNQEKTVSPSISVQNVTPDIGYTGLSKVTVNAVTKDIDSNINAGNIKKDITILGITGTYSGSEIKNQNKTVTSNGQVIADSGYTGLGTVTVDVQGGITPSGTKSIISNGTFDVYNYASAKVNVPNSYSGTVTITTNGDVSDLVKGKNSVIVDIVQPEIQTEEKTQAAGTSNITVTPSSGKYLSKVTITPTPTETATVKSTTTTQTITPTSGKYISSITVNPISVETKIVTPTSSDQIINPSSGKDYLSSISVKGVSLDKTTITPSTSSQTVSVLSNGTAIDSCTVNAVSSGNPSAITPTSFPVTVTPASGKSYMTNATVNAPTNLIAGNIKSGVNIAGITGTYTEKGEIDRSQDDDEELNFYLANNGVFMGIAIQGAASLPNSRSLVYKNILFRNYKLVSNAYTTVHEYTITKCNVTDCELHAKINDSHHSFQYNLSDNSTILNINVTDPSSSLNYHTIHVPANLCIRDKFYFSSNTTSEVGLYSDGNTWTIES